MTGDATGIQSNQAGPEAELAVDDPPHDFDVFVHWLPRSLRVAALVNSQAPLLGFEQPLHAPRLLSNCQGGYEPDKNRQPPAFRGYHRLSPFFDESAMERVICR